MTEQPTFRWRLPLIAAAGLMVGFAAPASASTFLASELSYDAALLSQFNLISLGDVTATSSQNIAGRALVGGNLTTTGTENVCASASCGNTSLSVNATTTTASTTTNPFLKATSASSNSATPANYGYGALTVFGNLTGTTTITNGGDIDVKGNLSGNTFTLNQKGGINYGGTSQLNTTASGPTEARRTTNGLLGTATNTPLSFTLESTDTLAQVFAPFADPKSLTNNFANPAIDLSRGIANLPGSPNVKTELLPINGTSLIASADYTTSCTGNGSSSAASCTYGVVKTTIGELAKPNFGGIQNGTNAATFVIVTGSLAAGATLPTLAANATGGYGKVIYDFVDATELRFAGEWNASILAPLASITAQPGLFNGSVVVASIAQSQALNAGNMFTGDLSGLSNVQFRRVPEPTTLSIIGVGLGAAALARRRRKK